MDPWIVYLDVEAGHYTYCCQNCNLSEAIACTNKSVFLLASSRLYTHLYVHTVCRFLPLMILLVSREGLCFIVCYREIRNHCLGWEMIMRGWGSKIWLISRKGALKFNQNTRGVFILGLNSEKNIMHFQ